MATGFDGGHPLFFHTEPDLAAEIPWWPTVPGEKDWARRRPRPLEVARWILAEPANRRRRLAKKVYIVAARTGTLTGQP
jgi:hypothetical protein